MAAAQPKAPAAFLSYAHLDEEASGGEISRLRRQLAHDVSIALGQKFEIFQDREDIAWGQHWPKRLDEALDQALFLIPILTPAFFNSEFCRGELEKFLERERRAGRDDLILPVYFVTARQFEDRSDRLAVLIRERQWRDWRKLRHRPVRSPKVRQELNKLAHEIEAAVHRPVPAVGGGPAPATRVETERTAVAAPAPSQPQPAAPIPKPVPQPGEVFRDVEAPWCPELVVIRAGRFLMGSPETEEGRYDNEGPQHEVMIGAPFALGRYPVTFAEYDAFCAATGQEKPGDEGWGRGRRPVINVSWEDAQGYVAWLRKETGQAYRLPSEAEWEYACRAGTTTPFWTGSTISTAQANYDGNHVYGAGRKGEYRQRTTPVDAFPANPWGLYDMHGNVWEWVEDCWHDSYAGAPTNGSAWLEGGSSARVVRGGSWYYLPRNLRSACRYRSEPDGRDVYLGFRVSRMLTP